MKKVMAAIGVTVMFLAFGLLVLLLPFALLKRWIRGGPPLTGPGA